MVSEISSWVRMTVSTVSIYSYVDLLLPWAFGDAASQYYYQINISFFFKMTHEYLYCFFRIMLTKSSRRCFSELNIDIFEQVCSLKAVILVVRDIYRMVNDFCFYRFWIWKCLSMKNLYCYVAPSMHNNSDDSNLVKLLTS